MNPNSANTVFTIVSTLIAWSILTNIQLSRVKRDVIIISESKLTTPKYSTYHLIFGYTCRKILRLNKTLQLYIQHLIPDTNNPNKFIQCTGCPLKDLKLTKYKTGCVFFRTHNPVRIKALHILKNDKMTNSFNIRHNLTDLVMIHEHTLRTKTPIPPLSTIYLPSQLANHIINNFIISENYKTELTQLKDKLQHE